MDTLSLLLPFFTQYGHIAVFVMLLICGLGLPLPEDITLVAGGIIAGLGYVSEDVMLIACLSGVLAGDTLVFTMGSLFGKTIKRWFWVAHLLNKKRLASAKIKSAQYSNQILFTARFLPGLRAVIFLTAGISHHVKFWRFLLIDSIAATISVPIWVYLGIYGARNMDQITQWIYHTQLGMLAFVILIILIVILLGWWYQKYRKNEPI
ncbi:MAG: DedA family protein [Neisseriales bacterium]|nr:MAG: DedA family protein [Neisseriales bacterium]